MSSDATGHAVEPDDPWVTAKKEMYPAASLGRIATNAKFTIATVSLVGTALTAAGLLTVATVQSVPSARILAIIAAGTALLAVVSALCYLAVRLEKRNYENYVEVKHWYERQFKRARLVIVASWLLIAAVLLAGAAGLVAALSPGKTGKPVLTLVVEGSADKRTVMASVADGGLDQGEVVTVQVTGDGGQVLLTAKTTADSTGTAKIESTVDDAGSRGGYRLVLLRNGQERASLQAP